MSGPPTGGSPRTPSLVGRAHEVGVLRRLIEKAEEGTGCLAVIEGEPGIGKTRLVDEVVTLVRARGWQVARGNSDELGRERPFGVVADALGVSRRSNDAERARIAQVLVGPPAVPAVAPLVDLRFHIVESICDLVERAAARGPLLLVAEDVQWADSSSLLMLHRLLGRVQPLPTLVLLTARAAPRSQELAQVLEAFERAGATHLRLTALSEDAVLQLAELSLGHRIGPRLRAEVARAGGNPLFTIELVEALKREGDIALVEGTAELERPIQPVASLRLAILRSVGSLPGEMKDLIGLASVLGSAFSVDELAAVTNRRPSELLPSVAAAIETGVLIGDGEHIAFRHDLVREAFYLDLPAAARNALHRQAAHALAAAGAPAQRVATHLSLAAVPGDSEAVEWLRRAALQVAPSGPGAAVALLERALELARPQHEGRVTLQADLILPLVWSGQINEAEAVARKVLARTDDVPVAAQTYHGLASSLYLQQRMPALAEMCDEALALDGLPSTERAFFLGLSTIPMLALGRIDETVARADATLAAAEDVGSPIPAFFATWAHGQVELLRGNYGHGVATLQGLVSLAHRSAVADGHAVGGLSVASLRIGLGHLLAAWGLLAADRPADAEASIEEARRALEETGAVPYISICHRSLATARFALGAWDDALAESHSAWLLADETGVHGLRSHQGDPAALIHMHRGDMGRAQLEIARMERALGPDAPLLVNLWLRPHRALVASASGERAAALQELDETCALGARLDVLPDYRLFGATLIHLARTAARPDLVERVAHGTRTLAQRAGGVASADAIALLCGGLAEDDLEALIAAVAAYRRAPSELDLALACEEAGAAHARSGHRIEAVALLDEARQIMDRLVADHDAARIRGRLRALGVKPGARAARMRVARGWESITRTELKVVELVSTGLSNPEIAERLYVSRRTVRAHLENVFRKLDVSSRAELAAVATRRTPAGTRPSAE